MSKKIREHGTGSVYRGADGRWVAQVENGYSRAGRRRYRRKTSASQAEVVAWLNAQHRGAPPPPEQQTVKAYLERWLTSCEAHVRARTLQGYRQICRDHLIPALGKVKLVALSRSHVQPLLDALHHDGHARNTIRNVRACLRTALADVRDQYPAAYTAASMARLPRVRSMNAPPEEPPIRALTPEQAMQLLRTVTGDRLEALYWTALLLGLRRGEVLGLRLIDLDLDAGTIRVSGQLQRQLGKGMQWVPAKTAASMALLPLPAQVVGVLRAHIARLREERTDSKWREHGLLFPSGVGTPLGERNLIRHYKNLLRRAGLPNIRFHDLRHTCATLLISLDVHPRVVMEILRHAQISTTMNVYGHAIPEQNRAAVDALGALVAPAMTPIMTPTPGDDA